MRTVKNRILVLCCFFCFLTHFSMAQATPAREMLYNRLSCCPNGAFFVVKYMGGGSLFVLIRHADDSLAVREYKFSKLPVLASESAAKEWALWIAQDAVAARSICHTMTRQSGRDDLLPHDSLLSLFNLDLEPVPERDQKKIGHESSRSEGVCAALWRPPCVVAGRKIKTNIEVWRGRWALGGDSPCAGSSLLLYCAADPVRAPAFPIWGELRTGKMDYRFYLLDSGVLHLE